MTEKAESGRRHRPFPGDLDKFGQELQVARARASEDAGSDLVRILTKLTSDVERFDSMVVLHRKVLEQRSGPVGAFDDDELNRRSQRISLEAADMVTSARQALEQLRRLGEPTKPLTVPSSHRNRASGLAKDRRQG
jgi:hypothetical protein